MAKMLSFQAKDSMLHQECYLTVSAGTQMGKNLGVGCWLGSCNPKIPCVNVALVASLSSLNRQLLQQSHES